MADPSDFKIWRTRAVRKFGIWVKQNNYFVMLTTIIFFVLIGTIGLTSSFLIQMPEKRPIAPIMETFEFDNSSVDIEIFLTPEDYDIISGEVNRLDTYVTIHNRSIENFKVMMKIENAIFYLSYPLDQAYVDPITINSEHEGVLHRSLLVVYQQSGDSHLDFRIANNQTGMSIDYQTNIGFDVRPWSEKYQYESAKNSIVWNSVTLMVAFVSLIVALAALFLPKNDSKKERRSRK